VVKDLGISNARRDSIVQIMGASKAAKSKRVSVFALQTSSRKKKAKGRAPSSKTLTRKKIG